MTTRRLLHLPMLLAIAGFACRGAALKTPEAVSNTSAGVSGTSQTMASAGALVPSHAVAQGAGVGDVQTATGSVAETMNSGGYTYARLTTDRGDVWIAASEFVTRAGDHLTVSLDMPMQNFHSKTLNRDFPMIYFVSQAAREGETLLAPPVEPVAPAPDGLTIADVWAKRTSLSGRRVVVTGKVVKVNNGILDRNWLHLQDGSGSAADHTNDLTVTTADDARVGDVVTASGMLAIGKDFGAGYAYDAILEKATVTPK